MCVSHNLHGDLHFQVLQVDRAPATADAPATFSNTASDANVAYSTAYGATLPEM